MASDNRVGLPSSGAGIVRYFDDYKSKIEFKPGWIIVAVIIIMALETLLYLYGNAIFGVA